MAKTYISNLTDFLDESGQLVDSPTPLAKMASFLASIAAAVTPKTPTLGHNTGVRCRKRGCKGVIHASLQKADDRITWWCLLCEQYGLISNWQKTKWDRIGAAHVVESAAVPICPANYTPKEGRYLAYIYYYTKLHRRPPAEVDMQEYFEVSEPTVHAMILKLERSGFITREPGMPRSVKLRLNRDQLPDLD